MIRIFIYSVLFLLICSCVNREINVCISNTSIEDKEVFVELFINEEKFVSQSFKSKIITPCYECFSFEVNEKKAELIVVTLDKNVLFRDTIDLLESKYVYVDYKYKVVNDTVGAYKYFLKYERIANTDSVIVEPRNFQVQYSNTPINIE